MTDSERVDAMRELHTHWYEQDAMTEMCSCQTRWPCDLQVVLDVLDVAERERDKFRQLMLSEHNRANEQEEAKQRQWWRAKSAEADLEAAQRLLDDFTAERDAIIARATKAEAEVEAERALRSQWWDVSKDLGVEVEQARSREVEMQGIIDSLVADNSRLGETLENCGLRIEALEAGLRRWSGSDSTVNVGDFCRALLADTASAPPAPAEVSYTPGQGHHTKSCSRCGAVYAVHAGHVCAEPQEQWSNYRRVVAAQERAEPTTPRPEGVASRVPEAHEETLDDRG